MKRIECIIMDWAGSAVDYGCFAPVAAFLKAFNEIGINITMEQARRPMGMAKIDHIRELFKMDGVGEEFEKLYHRPWNEQDVTDMNAKFEEYLFASLANYTDPIPGVIDTLNELRKQGIKIGYTTDKCVTPNGLPAGRPLPYMIYQNMIDLAIPSTDCVLKYGDTIADIKEGINAKVWTVGVILGSNELGLTQKEIEQMSPATLTARKAEVRQRMLLAGAHYVVDSIEELPQIIELINHKLNTNH